MQVGIQVGMQVGRYVGRYVGRNVGRYVGTTDLFHDSFDIGERDALIITSDDELEQIVAKYLKDLKQ